MFEQINLSLYIQKLRFYLRTVANSYAEIFFFENHLLGLVILGATFINPNVGLSGLLCVLAAYEFARFLGLEKIFHGSGFYTYNPLLVGLSIGYLFKLSIFAVFLIFAAGVMTFILTISLANVFYNFFRLPIINIPFVLVSTVTYLASYKYSNLLVNTPYPSLSILKRLESSFPIWFTSLAKSLGALLFCPNFLGGLIFLTVIFFASRILFILSIGGYFLGVFILSLMEGSFYQAVSNLGTFNFSLIAMAIGGVFLIPGPRSYLLSALAVAISPFLLDAANFFWAGYGIPIFTLPFNLVVLSMIYTLGLAGYPFLTSSYRGTPERTLDHYLSYLTRFRGTFRTLTLPFSGVWTVWQGFDGSWTHQGIWRYGIDFLITDELGQTHSGEGILLEDYYCFQKPILSPIKGRVVAIMNDVPDNPPGILNETQNFGNYVMLYDERGFYVLLAHLKKGSIRVSEGQWVAQGQLVGLCGNSGYSPQPHLHVQIQFSPELGAPTQPFSFVHYMILKDEKIFYKANDIPKENERVKSLYPDKALESSMSLVLDQEMSFEITLNDKKLTTETLRVHMSPDGSYYLRSKGDCLYFVKSEGTFYFLRHDGSSLWGKAFFLAAPRLPLVYQKRMIWEDFLPLETFFDPMRKAILILLASFNHRLAEIKGTYWFEASNEIRGEVKSKDRYIKTRVKLDNFRGFIAELTIEEAGKILNIRRI